MTRKIALLSDVHGNSTALEAVLADAESQQVTDYWFLGDLLLPGIGRRNILDRMEKLHISLQVKENPVIKAYLAYICIIFDILFKQIFNNLFLIEIFDANAHKLPYIRSQHLVLTLKTP